jgi:hypothetical protein
MENMTSTSEYPAAIRNYDSTTKYNITGCIIRNITSSHGSPRAGAINCYMNNNNNFNIWYNISENTFIEIKTNKSVTQLAGSFISLSFSYNSFYNISLTKQEGFFLILLLAIYFANI